MPKIAPKHRNEVIVAVAQQIVARQNPGCYVPPGSAAVEKVYSALEEWLCEKGFDPNRFEFPQKYKKSKGVAVSFDIRDEGEVTKISVKQTVAV